MTFEGSYNIKVGFFGLDYALAKSLLPTNTSPIEVYRRICWAKLASLGTMLVEEAQRYINLPRAEAQACAYNSSAPCVNLRQLQEQLLGSKSVTLDPYTSDVYILINARLAFERSKGIFVEPDEYLLALWNNAAIESKNIADYSTIDTRQSAKSSRGFVNNLDKKKRFAIIIAQCVNALMDTLWVLNNSKNIIADARYLQDRYIQDMHPVDFNHLRNMEDICLCFSDKQGYAPYMLRLEQCDDWFCFIDGHIPEAECARFFEHPHTKPAPKRCYAIKFIPLDRETISPLNLIAFVIEGSDKCYICKDLIDLRIKSVPNFNLPAYKAVTYLYGNKASMVDWLYGFRLNRLPQVFSDADILWRAIRVLFECTYQFELPVEKARVLDEGGALRGRNFVPAHTGTPDSKNTTAPLKNLIKYVYTGERTSLRQRNGTHASPCEHKRKAHLRRLSSGKVIEVKGSIVNKGGRQANYKLANPNKC